MRKKIVALLLTAILLISSVSSVLAVEHSINITFPVGRTNLAYGPSVYHRKISGNIRWKGSYTAGPYEHHTLQIYLYDRTIGDQATHRERVNKGNPLESFEFLGRSGQDNHEYKLVMILDSLPHSNLYRTYSFLWNL
jgi:hypothetical protein